VFPVEHFIHGLFVNFHHGAIGHCGCGAQAERLPCQATFSEKKLSTIVIKPAGCVPPTWFG